MAFNIRPFEELPDYFSVCVQATQAAMLDAMRASGCWTTDDTMAACICASSREFPALRGLLFFAQEHFGGGIVSHELAHATFRIMDHARIRVEHDEHGVAGPFTTHPTEELYCKTLERLTKEFWRAYYDRNLGAAHA